MENKTCTCKKSKDYYTKSKCKSNRHKKSYISHNSSDSSTDNSHRKQSIKINVDCNRGGDDMIKPKQCIKNQDNEYKDELLKYLISNKYAPPPQSNVYQNNIKFISGIISPCLDNAHHQTGQGYTADFIHTSTNNHWIIKIECNHIINFILTNINNTVSNNAVIDNSSIETSANFQPRFTNRIIINITEPIYGFTFLALCN